VVPRLVLIAVGFSIVTASAARAQGCNAPTARFRGAVLKPGENSARLAAKLARTGDYGTHAVAGSLRVCLRWKTTSRSQGIAKAAACFHHESDDDLTFSVVLSPESKKKLAKYFDGADKVPGAVEVEMVASLSVVRGPVAFRTWKPGSESVIEFATGDNKLRPIAPATDWPLFHSPEWRSIRVRGALVVDYAGNKSGDGLLEIHPAERVRLLRDLPEHH
jgi:hypothetical protein